MRRVLFDARAHEPLLQAEWSPSAVRDAIRAIARETDEALRDREFWPLHPLDDDGETPGAVHGVYFGAAGVLWALHRLAAAGLHEPAHDYARLAAEALESYLRRPELGGPMPSLWLGEGGIALVAWLLSPSEELADRLARLVVADPQSDTLELMWGSPGLLLIADVMLERTGEERWRSAWRAIADRLVSCRGAEVPGLWTQRLYGSTVEYLGPAHGSAGVVAALARRPELLAPERLLGDTAAALSATAIREGDRANWPALRSRPLAGEDRVIRTQWCHGAPGIVASLVSLPHGDDGLEALLPAGGELTWAAGPLRKGAGLCHGTAGNGLALLALHARTGDELWLARARRFAMHAAAQVSAATRRYGRGRHTLWTGDLGTAVYLEQCLAATPGAPALEVW